VAQHAPDTLLHQRSDRGKHRALLWRDLIAPTEGRAAFALRLAIIATLGLAVTQIYGTPEPALTVYLTFFLNKPDRVSSVVLNIVMVVAVTLVVLLLFGLAHVVVEAPPARLATMTLMSFALMFLASASKLRPLAPSVAVCVVYALALLGMAPGGEAVTRALLYAWLFVGIPAGVSLAVNLVAAPAPRILAERALAQRLRVGAAALRDAVGGRTTLDQAISEAVAPILAGLRLATLEHTSPHEDLAGLRKAALSSQMLLVQIAALGSLAPPVWRDDIATVLDEMAAVLEQRRYPRRVPVPAPDLPLEHAQAAGLTAGIVATLADFGVATGNSPADKERSGFFVDDAFTSPVHTYHAVKATLAAMICYLGYSVLAWPGIHTCLITCYVVALGSTGETIEKLTLRIMGCLVGAAFGVAAIIWVIPSFDSLGGPMALIFLATLPAAWVAAGSPRIGYAGFQIAYAFYLCVIQGDASGVDLAVARDRIVGILVGNAVIYLVFTRIWPVSLAAKVERSVRGLVLDLARMAGVEGEARLVAASDLDVGLAEARADLAVIAYEPAPLRPSPAWQSRRGAALDQLAALEHRLIVTGSHAAIECPELAARLIRIGASDGPGEAHAESDEMSVTAPCGDLDRLEASLA
jgi:multidrug resistance protein MdtO